MSSIRPVGGCFVVLAFFRFWDDVSLEVAQPCNRAERSLELCVSGYELRHDGVEC
jgi:hypothetical protein